MLLSHILVLWLVSHSPSIFFTDCLCHFPSFSWVSGAPDLLGQALHRPVLCHPTSWAVWQWGPERERFHEDHSSPNLRQVPRSACSHKTTNQPHLLEVSKHCYNVMQIINLQVWVLSILVPIPIPSFSMLHTAALKAGNGPGGTRLGASPLSLHAHT